MPIAGLGAGQHRPSQSLGGQADNVLDLAAHLVDVGGGQVDLVDHRHDLMVVLDRLVDVGERLRLHPLRRVDDQQRALAGGEAAADLIGEIDMAGRVHQVEDVIRAVRGAVIEPHRLRLDRDPALLLELHIVEHLAVRHLARGQPAGGLDQPVGQGRFAMVDMGDDGEIADAGKVGHWTRALAGQAGDANREQGARQPQRGSRIDWAWLKMSCGSQRRLTRCSLG